MKAIDFRGFRFGKIHTSDLHLEVISSSDRYEPRMIPAPNDVVQDVPGGDGQYYFGSTYKNREITCNLAFDNVSEQDYRKIRQLFANDKLQDLVFDEEPYKTWKAKIKGKPEFKSLCFEDKETCKRIYKGSGKITFICYYPYAFGLDKYVVRAADYYMLNTPECIIEKAQQDDTFVKNSKDRNSGKILDEDIKYHYNLNPSDYEGGTTEENIRDSRFRDKSHRNQKDWEPNDKKVWKTGFPTPEQVSAGELYFDTDQGEKSIIDVRTYWDNIPAWQDTAKLLTTPTLDYEQELMYLPQYSKTDFINMELGFENGRPMIGSRLLVYNPGDVPVDWELRFDENKRSFWSYRGGAKFRIRRFNVERLGIENAVDWCGLTTYNSEDNEPFKYGNRYFKRRTNVIDQIVKHLEDLDDEQIPQINKPGSDPNRGYYTKQELIDKIKTGIIPADKVWDETTYPYSEDKTLPELGDEAINYTSVDADKVGFNLHLNDKDWAAIVKGNAFKGLGKAHPHHCYYVEPIPRQKLAHYIKLFFWQTIEWRGDRLPTGHWIADERYLALAKDILHEEDGSIYVNDINNPLTNFLRMFANIDFGGRVTTKSVDTPRGVEFRDIYKDLDYERGIEIADRYTELLSECVDEQEEYELYWKTLKLLLSEYAPIINKSFSDWLNESHSGAYSLEAEVEKFIDSYINHPTEFINTDMRDLDYNADIFNGYKMPEWMTDDYMEIDQMALSGVSTAKQFLEAMGEGFDKVFTGCRRQYTKEDRDKLTELGETKLILTLDKTIGINGFINDLLDDYYYLNTDNRMLYTTANPYGMEFVYKPNKVVMNEAITKGKWFKLPPGWSLICVEPIVDEATWGGKRWVDARPYDWGYGGDLNRNQREVQQLYDFVYAQAREEFFKIYPLTTIENIIPPENLKDYEHDEDMPVDGAEYPVDELLKFKVWYEDKLSYFDDGDNYFAKCLFRKYKNDGEYTFLKLIHSLWSQISPFYTWTVLKGVYTDPDTNEPPALDDYDIAGFPLRCINGDISDWWWYACNYLWSNFPPLYWATADMLNRLQIKYTPLYY